MRRPARHYLVYASVLALVLVEVFSARQGEVVRNPKGEVAAAAEVGVGPLLLRPRVVPPPPAEMSEPVFSTPGVVTLSHVGHLPVVIAELSLQTEHVRLQI